MSALEQSGLHCVAVSTRMTPSRTSADIFCRNSEEMILPNGYDTAQEPEAGREATGISQYTGEHAVFVRRLSLIHERIALMDRSYGKYCVIFDGAEVGVGTRTGNFILIRDKTRIGKACTIGAYVDTEGTFA